MLNLPKIIFSMVMIFSFSLSANAQMIKTSTMLKENSSRKEISKFLERKEVMLELQHYGVSKKEAQKRLLALSDSEVNQLASELHKNQAGGEIFSFTNLLLIILILVLVF